MSWLNSTILIKKKTYKKKTISSYNLTLKNLRLTRLVRGALSCINSDLDVRVKSSKSLCKLLNTNYSEVVTKRSQGLFSVRKLQIRDPRIFKKFRTILNSSSGRNNSGKITVRHRGGGLYRSFIRNFQKKPLFSNIPTRVICSHRLGLKTAANFGLCLNNLGVFSYMLAPDKLDYFSNVFNSNRKMTKQLIKSPGSRTTLRLIPTGSLVYNVELFPNKGAQLARSAGTKIKLMMKKKLYNRDFAGILLPSKKLIYVPLDCQASIGSVSNPLHKLNDIKFAGIKRNFGFRPSVRGVAMNPIDHHHGGGEGKTSSGPKPKTAWGKTWRYVKTRSQSKEMNFKIFINRMNKNGSNIASIKKFY